jgi:23S rRNA pseudouridine2457 synthase
MSHQHFILHKPHGYLSPIYLRIEKEEETTREFYNFPKGTMSIGRLDEDSELLLLTTDGMMRDRPFRKSGQEYYVQVDGIITQEAMID